MDDIFILEAADNVDDGVALADGGEELVAEAFSVGGSFDEAGDVDEFEGGRHDL